MKKQHRGITTLIILSLISMGLLLFSYLAGYRFYTVISPSMGITAPVGTLVVTKDSPNYEVNDIVSFHRGDRVYTHRIVAKNSTGEYTTKGDLNAVNDALPLKHKDIIGKSVFIGKYLGWLWRALPIITIGVLIAWVISTAKKVSDGWRWPIRIFGYCISVMVATFILNPWNRAEMIGYGHIHEGKYVEMTIVNTGIFPLSDENGGRFYAGETRTVKATETDDLGRFYYLPRPSLGFWGTILVALWCLLPMFVALSVKLPLDEEQLKMEKDELQKEKRTSLVIFAIITLLTLAIVAFHLSTLAAFTASISNSTNSLRTADFFTCNSTHFANAIPRPLFAYSMNNDGIPDTTVDVSGNGNTGTYSRTNPRIFPATQTDRCGKDANQTALTFSDTTCITNNLRLNSPNTFTIETWFGTNHTGSINGRMVGFSRVQGRIDGRTSLDRLVYLDQTGKVVFGLYPGRVATIYSQRAYNDGQTHHLAATLGADGMKLYIDGELVASDPSVTRGENFPGYWTIGCGHMWGWRNADRSSEGRQFYFNGWMRNTAIYDVALTEAQIKAHYNVGK